MNIYKVDTKSLKFHTTYVKAENIEDCLYKIRKFFESQNNVFSDEMHKWITKIELITECVIE